MNAPASTFYTAGGTLGYDALSVHSKRTGIKPPREEKIGRLA
jgi:hypothetical protein